MPRQNRNTVVELKVLTAVLEERFKNQREHFESRFDEIKEALEKGSQKMNCMQEEIETNSRFRRDAKIVIGTIGSIFGAIGGFITMLISKYFK